MSYFYNYIFTNFKLFYYMNIGKEKNLRQIINEELNKVIDIKLNEFKNYLESKEKKF